jgi:hypothetical protein
MAAESPLAMAGTGSSNGKQRTGLLWPWREGATEGVGGMAFLNTATRRADHWIGQNWALPLTNDLWWGFGEQCALVVPQRTAEP